MVRKKEEDGDMFRQGQTNIPTYGIGEAIGVILWRAWYPALRQGHHNHATTYEFPVRFEYIDEWGLTSDHGGALEWNLPGWIECARKLESDGVAAITTNCGLTGSIQKELAEAVNIPVFASSLLQVPLVHSMLKPGKKVGILTASEALLRDNDNLALRTCGIDDNLPVALYGMEEYHYDEHMSQFADIAHRPASDYDPVRVEQATVSLAQRMVSENPEVGAIVMECTEMPLYAAAVQEATGLLVFDSTTLVRYVYHAIVKKHYF